MDCHTSSSQKFQMLSDCVSVLYGLQAPPPLSIRPFWVIGVGIEADCAGRRTRKDMKAVIRSVMEHFKVPPCELIGSSYSITPSRRASKC